MRKFTQQTADALVRKFTAEANMPIVAAYDATRNTEFVWNVTDNPDGLRFALCKDGTLHLTGMIDNCPFADGNNVCKVHDGNVLLGYLNWKARKGL